MLRFISLLSSANHSTDSKTLVTVGSWSELTQKDSYGQFNHYKDQCVTSAGGQSNGIIDFYQMQTYSLGGQWNPNASFKV